MKISELLDSIRNYDLVLPEFQREYVWTRDQANGLAREELTSTSSGRAKARRKLARL
jgi:hypothetical protein